MDLSPVADIFDCVTAVGDTERFLASLTASPPVNFTFSSHPDDFNALPFDMPLAHALATSEPAPALLPNPPPPHPDTHKPHFHHIRPSHSPVSALTGATVASPPPPARSKRRISKKKAAHHHHPHPAHTVAAIAASLATHNMSAVSDVTYPHSPPISSPKSSSVSNLSSPTSLQLAVGLSASLPSPHPAPTRPANKPTTQPSTPQHPSSASPVSNNRDTPAEPPKSHTRRCREKVTRQFEHLLEVLPPPSRGVEVRHKAQILDYTINVFRSLLARRTFLHTHIALASNDTLLQWVNATLLRASSTLKPDSLPHSLSIASLLDPFMSLYCVKHSWSYAEAWVLTPDTKHAALNSYVVNSEDSKVSANLEVFAAASKARYGAASEIVSGVVSRARQTKHPEWLIDLSHDQSVFDRADLAAKHAIQIALAVPVVAENMCLAVLVFSHSTHRTFSAAEVDQLFGFASVLGKRFVQYSRGCVLQIQQQQQQQHEQQHHHHHHQQRQHQQQQPKQEQQHQVIPMSPDASSIINPGVSVDATSAVGVFEALPTPLPVAAPTWTIPAPMLLPQLSEASSKSLFEDTKLLSENVLKSC